MIADWLLVCLCAARIDCMSMNRLSEIVSTQLFTNKLINKMDNPSSFIHCMSWDERQWLKGIVASWAYGNKIDRANIKTK